MQQKSKILDDLLHFGCNHILNQNSYQLEGIKFSHNGV
jgi:hypothetical protein